MMNSFERFVIAIPIAYCLACYATDFVLFIGRSFDVMWLLIAPLHFPVEIAISILLIGNSEIPTDTSRLFRVLAIFASFGIAFLVIVTRWLGRPPRVVKKLRG